MSDFTVAAFCKITSGAAQLYSWVGRGTRVRSLCTRPSWLQEETQSQVHVLRERRDHHTVHLWNICSEHWPPLWASRNPARPWANPYRPLFQSTRVGSAHPHHIWLFSLAHSLKSQGPALSFSSTSPLQVFALQTGCFCMACSTQRSHGDWLLLVTEVVAQKLPPQRGFPRPPRVLFYWLQSTHFLKICSFIYCLFSSPVC